MCPISAWAKKIKVPHRHLSVIAPPENFQSPDDFAAMSSAFFGSKYGFENVRPPYRDIATFCISVVDKWEFLQTLYFGLFAMKSGVHGHQVIGVKW